MAGKSAGTASSTVTGRGAGDGAATGPDPMSGSAIRSDPMSTLSERLHRGAATAPSQVDHARRLVADWQLLADLSFADLTLWVPLKSGAWWCVAQVRPLTAPTSRPEDLVGCGAAAARGDPGPARRRRRRRPGQGHQPRFHPVAVDPGAHLPRHRRGPD